MTVFTRLNPLKSALLSVGDPWSVDDAVWVWFGPAQKKLYKVDPGAGSIPDGWYTEEMWKGTWTESGRKFCSLRSAVVEAQFQAEGLTHD